MKDLKEKKQVIEPNLLYNLHILKSPWDIQRVISFIIFSNAPALWFT